MQNGLSKITYFRFEAEGRGIYEAVDLACPRDDARRTGKPDGSWLPRAGEKYPGALSFWKRAGLDKYQESGLRRWHESVVQAPVEVIVRDQIPQSDVLYHDDFQVICRPNSENAFKLRNASAKDTSGIASVHVTAWQEAYAGLIGKRFLSTLSVEKRREAWAKTLSGEDPIYGQSSVKVLEDDKGEIVGFASGGTARGDIPNHDCEVYAIYLLKKLKGTGLGSLLFRELLSTLKDRKFGSAGLWVLEQNPTRSFYEYVGGKLLNETKKAKIGDEEHSEVAYGWRLA